MKIFFTTLFSLFSLFAFTQQHNWVRTSPGGGGAINLVVATPPDAQGNSTILVASDLSGVYRSTDNGASFDVVGATQGLEDTHISAFGLDPNNPQKFFVGTYLYLYKTEDGGNSFTTVFPTANNEYCYVEDVVIAKSNSNIGYVTYHPLASSNGEVYKTTDGGNTWGSIVGENLPNDLRLVKLLVHPTNENVVYVLSGKTRWGCGKADLYRSEDGGVNWTKIGLTGSQTAKDILDFDVHPNNPDVVYISTFRSVYVDNASCRDLDLDAYIYEHPTENYASEGALYKSDNKGSTFAEIGAVTGIISVENNVATNQNPQVIRVVNSVLPYDWNDDAGIWTTTNGGTTWTQTSDIENWKKGYTLNQYFAFTQSSNGYNKTVQKDIFNPDRFFGSFGQWAWASLTPGGNMDNITTKEIGGAGSDRWLSTGVENTIGTSMDINETDPNIVYMGGYDIGFWYTLDGGDSWRRRQPNYNTYGNLYSWDVGTQGQIDAAMAMTGAGSNVMNIVSDPVRTNVVWATFSNGQYYDIVGVESAKTGLFRSTDNGENWTLLSSGLPAYANSDMMYGLTMDINSGTATGANRTLYVTVNSDVYKSTNDGDTWSKLTTPTAMKVKFLEVDKVNGTVYAGGISGLWRSTTGGTAWTKVSTTAMEASSTNMYPDIIPTYVSYDNVGNITHLPWEGVFDIMTDPNHGDRVYAVVHAPNGNTPGGIQGGLYRSNDAGATWLPVLYEDLHLRGVAIAPANSELVYVTSSESYNSGGFGNSAGVLYSKQGGAPGSWHPANDGMAYHFAGAIEIETGDNPQVWTWSLGTGMQKAVIPFTVLPVEYLSPFSARLSQGVVHLDWETAEEVDADYFIIEKSPNATDWSELAVVSAQNRPAHYTRIDTNPFAPVTYYRLKQVDLDGRFEYSGIASVQVSPLTGKTNIYPNPAKSFLKIQTNQKVESLKLINTLGQVVRFIDSPISNTLSLEGIQQGMYFLKVRTTYGNSTHQLRITD